MKLLLLLILFSVVCRQSNCAVKFCTVKFRSCKLQVKVQYSDPSGSFLHTAASKQVEVVLRHGKRPGTAEIEIGLPKLVRRRVTHEDTFVFCLLPVLTRGCELQLQLPIQPPMALLASKTADGIMGLRWSKIRLGSGSSSMVKTVQVCGSPYCEL